MFKATAGMGLALLCAETGWCTTAAAQDAAAQSDEPVGLVVNRIFNRGALGLIDDLMTEDVSTNGVPLGREGFKTMIEDLRVGRPLPLVSPVTPGRNGPGFDDGQLWVRPVSLPPQKLAQRLRKADARSAESLARATNQALDSIAREPSADHAELPEWSTEIVGKKFGIDKKYMTVAGLKIPAPVLALLPLYGGTIEWKAFDQTDQLLVDLRSAANRAQTVNDFKRAISEMRKRREEERELQKNQRHQSASP